MAGFSFPPPPPPPPKAAPQESSATNHAQPGAFMYGPGLGRGGGGRGGGDRGRGRGRGRGNNNRGGFGRGGANNTHPSPHQAPHFNRALPQQQHQNGVANVSPFNMPALPVGGYINPAFSSMYTNGLNSAPSAPQPWLAHTQPSQNSGQNLPRPTSSHRTQAKPKVQVAPSVPSFGFALDVVKPQVPSTSNRDGSTSKKRKHNGLGLTPRSDIREDSEEDDADEEAKYSVAGGVLQFEYKGRSSTLKPEDIAAWIDERKKRFPTKDRVAQRKKEEEEAKEARRLAREQAGAEYKSKHPQQERQTKKRKPNKDAGEQDKAIQKAEKLREKLRKAEGRIAKVMAKRESIPKKAMVEDAPKNSLGIDYDSDDSAGPAGDEGSNSLAESSSEVSSDSDSDDSSSSDDESDDDVPPEKESAEKRPMKVFLPNRKAPPAGAQQTRREREKNPPKRMTLRERMVEQEHRQEAELALQAIKLLGENGMLG